MATNHTENYNLNLWEPTDSFVREEFNQNTSKIDEVLHRADRRGLQLIREYTTTESKSFLEVDLSDLDWSEWHTVHVDVIPAFGSTENAVLSALLSGANNPRINFWNRFTVFPLGEPDSPLSGIMWGKTASFFFYPGCKASMCHPRIFGDTGSDLILAGTKVVVRGERV